MKSIRKCDEKVRAQQLGVKVGDKFVVLSPEDSYDEEKHNRKGRVGDVLILKYDDLSSCPLFVNIQTGDEYYEYFSCLARYEEDKEATVLQEEPSLQNVKFDMKAIAEELGVSLEKAHNIVQAALFERGLRWRSGRDTVQYTDAAWLCVDQTDAGIVATFTEDQMKYPKVSIKPQYSFYVKEEKPKTIEFNGKQYNKDDVAKALALLSPIN